MDNGSGVELVNELELWLCVLEVSACPDVVDFNVVSGEGDVVGDSMETGVLNRPPVRASVKALSDIVMLGGSTCGMSWLG